MCIRDRYQRRVHGVLSDEVYEFMLFDGRKHLTLATYPEIRDRVISIHSLGKTFSCTGWRVGFTIANPTVSAGMMASQNWNTFLINRPASVAIKDAMIQAEQPYENFPNYYEFIGDLFIKRKNEVVEILQKAPFNWHVLVPEGGFFACCDIRKCIKDIPRKYFYRDYEHIQDGDQPISCSFKEVQNPEHLPDYAFFLWLTVEYKVTCIPMNSFHDTSNTDRPEGQEVYNFVRFALCKSCLLYTSPSPRDS
eukprot:TRINITY_DN642_c0_g1_i19.p1 TRINITY_DN642_c0_g1~~TRINITY_DN642_c0_g1_i19.p1  ORF type:complete len:250 (-),score=63.00 TRINITY_DN642_c0_g1_i19:52-801(-)